MSVSEYFRNNCCKIFLQKVRINSPKSELIHKIPEAVEETIALHRTHMHKTTYAKYKMHLNNLLCQKKVRIKVDVEGIKNNCNLHSA